MGWRQDVRYALRLLRRAPGFAAIAIATLALGIGATTAIFTFVNAVLLRPLSFSEPQRLTMIRPSSGSRLSPAYVDQWRLQNRTLDDIAGWHDVRANLTGRGEPLEVLVDRVTPNFFTLLGTPASLGRTFTVGAQSHVEPEAILSHGFWQRRYGGDPAIIGQKVTLDGDTLTIVGVMPEGFTIRTTELAESRAEIWTPFRLVPGDPIGMGGSLNVVARLAPGSTVEQARADVSAIARRVENEHPSYSHDWSVDVVPLLDATVKDVRLSLLVLFGAVGILLLIACANVANLTLGRAARRQSELAIRMALGATSGRLVRQFLTESFVLSLAGGALGLVLAAWGTGLLVSALPAGLDLPRTGDIGVDVSVLGFAFLVTMMTAILFGLLPSLSSAGPASSVRLREVTRGASRGRGGHRTASTLIVAEVALALILLAGAGLLGRSFWELSRVHPGFQSARVLTLRTTLPASRYETDDRMRNFSSDILERVANLPGIRAVGSVNYVPMNRFGAAVLFNIDGRPGTRADDQHASWVSVVGGDYFEAMGIPLVRGRLPGEADTDMTQPVFVIDEALARRDWPNEDPIGAHIAWRRAEGERFSGEIVGVVGSVRWQGMAADPPAAAYWWFPQVPVPELTIVARTDGDPVTMAGAVAAEVRAIDPNQPVAEIRTMQDLVSADLARPRFTMLLLTGFAATALVLAAIGLYGVIAFAVTERTREIGVRVALGAQSRDVLRLVMRHGLRLTGAGLLIGAAAALALGRVVAGLLYGVTPSDPVTLLGVALFLAVVATGAIYFPARQAMRVDPMVAMRIE